MWFALPYERRAPGDARRLIDRHTEALDVTAHDDLFLLVSEFVTNAVLHGRPDVTLHLTMTAELQRVDVFDHGVPLDWPGGRTTEPILTGPRGRGLAIVDLLATRWGTAASTVGKSVWFELGAAS